MKLIPISDILISPDRQRRLFDAGELMKLQDSIEQNGLFHALGLRKDWIENEATGRSHWGLTLVHGERRLRAIRDIYELGGQFNYDGERVPLGTIPYTDLGQLSVLDAEVYELEENIQREDLTLQEECESLARIARIRGEQAALAGLPPPSTGDLVREIRPELKDIPKTELGWRAEDLRRKIRLAELMKEDSEIAAATTVKEAWKIAKRKEERARNVELADTVGKTFTADLHRLHNSDALDWLAACPDNLFDVILTDPPYGMGADEFGDSAGKTAGQHSYVDDRNNFLACWNALKEHALRITKAQAHLYVFCDIDNFHEMRNSLQALALSVNGHGWWVFRTPLIWHKPAAPRSPWPEHGPQRKYECILYAVKGKRITTGVYPDVITCNPDLNLGHAAQKPVALYAELLRRSVRPGDHVLDCFAGSGPIIPAAHSLKCVATVVEKEPAAFGLCVGRAKALKSENDLLEGLV